MRFIDASGAFFASVNIHIYVSIESIARTYISTDRGLFLYNGDTGEVTALDYDLTDIVHMTVYKIADDDTKILAFRQQKNATGKVTGYYAQSLIFSAPMVFTLAADTPDTTIPVNVSWIPQETFVRTDISITTANPICYASNIIWCATIRDREFRGIREINLTDVTAILQVINRNTFMITHANTIMYYVITQGRLYQNTDDSLLAAEAGTLYSHPDTLSLAAYHGQCYTIVSSELKATFILFIDTTGALLIGYILSDHNIHIIGQKVFNCGCVNRSINHRLYSKTDPTGYTHNGNTYPLTRHIFVSSTRLMDINDNLFAAASYFGGDTTNYSIMPATDKTPIFTINTSIEIDSQKYGNVIATSFDTVNNLYYIYTNSHVGTYYITSRRLSWALSDVATQTTDIDIIGDIMVIDGRVSPYVNGIMTSVAMHGPTFDGLYAAIEALRRRITALEDNMA